MATTIVKLVAIPAAIGLASFRVYATSENKTEDVQLSPRELSIYAQDPSATQYLAEQPGPLERGLGVVRLGLQPYVRAVKNGYSSAKVGAVTVYTTGHDTYEFLRSPPPGFIPRVSVITVSGLAGLILARKGSNLKRMGVPLGLAAVGTAMCYPTQTVCVVKVTGQKIYAGSQYTTSSVASVFISKPKEFTPPSVSYENQALPVLITEPEAHEAKPLPETETSKPATSQAEPDLHPSTELPHTEGSIDTKPSARIPQITDVLEQQAVLMEIVSAIESAHVKDDVPAHSEDAATVEVSVLVIDDEAVPLAVEATPPADDVVFAHPEEAVAAQLAPVDTVHAPPPTEEVFSVRPLSDITGIVEAFPAPVDGVSALSPIDEVAPPPAPVVEAAPLPAPIVEAAPLPAPIVEAAPPPTPVVEAEPPLAPIGAPPLVDAPSSVDEEAVPPPTLVDEEAAPPPAPVDEDEPTVIVMKTTGKPKFAPDPKLVDLGQASPEDEDLYSTRG